MNEQFNTLCEKHMRGSCNKSGEDLTRVVACNFLWGGSSSIDRNFMEDITKDNF